MAVPGFVRRYTRILDALDRLQYYDDGLPLAQLADELGVPVDELRTEILAYYTAEPASSENHRLPGIAWLSPSGEEQLPQEAEVLVLTDPRALAGLGTVRLALQDVAGIWRAGRILAEYEPDNETLTQALEVLETEWLEGPEAGTEAGAEHVATIRNAIDQQRRLRFRYAREWRPGIADREVEPYRLLRTGRGWELDAGPLDAQGAPRTFLLTNITSDVEMIEQPFEVPDGIDRILAQNRAQIRVELSLPQRSAWGVDTQADSSRVLASDEETVTVQVELSPPYANRLALSLAPTMGEGMLMTHRDLAPEVNAFGTRLLAHHGFAIP